MSAKFCKSFNFTIRFDNEGLTEPIKLDITNLAPKFHIWKVVSDVFGLSLFKGLYLAGLYVMTTIHRPICLTNPVHMLCHF